jgi:outer membrane biosynthesis protein TonB
VRGTNSQIALACLVAFALAAEAVYIARSDAGDGHPVVKAFGTAEPPQVVYHPKVKEPPDMETETGDGGESELPAEPTVEEDAPPEVEEPSSDATEETPPAPPEAKPVPQTPKPPEER